MFLALPGLKPFRQQYDVRTLPARPSCCRRCSSAITRRPAATSCPPIAIVDWHEVPTQSEFRLFKAYFESLGFTCIIADPRELEYTAGRCARAGR